MTALVAAAYTIDAFDPSLIAGEMGTRPQPSRIASAAAGALPVPFPDIGFETLFFIDLPDFGSHLASPITGFQFVRESGTVTLQANVGNDVVTTLTLLGKLSDAFRIEEVSIDIRTLQDTPRAEFIASTLFALLGLSRETELRIPVIGLGLRQRFDLSLKRLSQRLQMRQTAYRLMVIERATGLEFSLPQNYLGEDVKTIAYLYHAIVERSFAWPIATVTVYVPATQERLLLFPRDDTPTRQELGPTRVVKNLFGHTIEIGEEELFLDDAVIENLAAVRSELARNDGHPVEVTIRSLSGAGRVVLKNAPRLPDSAWDSSIQALIDLEPPLNACLADHYNALAASTLNDLTEEEKREVTARAELDEANSALNDSDGESI